MTKAEVLKATEELQSAMLHSRRKAEFEAELFNCIKKALENGVYPYGVVNSLDDFSQMIERARNKAASAE
jgi:sRNA-binding regulator protein Hfq